MQRLLEELTIVAYAKRVMSLQEPHLKMSKSHQDPRSRILVTDSPEEISRKVKAALTDSLNSVSYDPLARPGVSNLLQLLSYFDYSCRSADELGKEHAAMSLGKLKALVSESISASLADIRTRYNQFMVEDNGRYLDYVEAKGAAKARASAEVTMVSVRKAVGLL
jgi:tryptophanyl-tRNA synthetase